MAIDKNSEVPNVRPLAAERLVLEAAQKIAKEVNATVNVYGRSFFLDWSASHDSGLFKFETMYFIRTPSRNAIPRDSQLLYDVNPNGSYTYLGPGLPTFDPNVIRRRTGSRVFWNDPDGGRCSAAATVIDEKEGDVLVLRTDSGSEVEAFAHEVVDIP